MHHTTRCVHRRWGWSYGVATVSRIDKFIDLFCKRALQMRRYSAKENYKLIDATNSSHPIVTCNALQHMTTHRNTPQHTHHNTLQHGVHVCVTQCAVCIDGGAGASNIMYCNTLQHTHCNTPQHRICITQCAVCINGGAGTGDIVFR